MAGTFYAVLIGNHEFPGEPALPSLRCPLNDVRGMAELLKAEQYGPYQVSVLEDEEHHIVHREIYRALKRAGREDRVLLYYAGHGKLNDDDGNLYLASRNTVIEDLPASSVSVADVMRYMNTSASKQLILILDCCYSGAVDRLMSNALHRGEASDQVASNFRGAGGSGSYILTASTSLQRAEEREGDHHGLLTKHVIAGIRDGHADRDDDGFVSMHELTLYVQDQVRAEGRQTPLCYTLREEDGGLVIAKTGKAARTRKIAEVLDEIYATATAHRASLRTVRAALALVVPDAAAPIEDKLISNQFVDDLHIAMRDSRRFIEVLEDAPSLAARLVGASTEVQRRLEAERREARQELQAALDGQESLGKRYAELSEKFERVKDLVSVTDKVASELNALKQTREKERLAQQSAQAKLQGELALAQKNLAEQTRLRQQTDAAVLSERERFGEAGKRIEELTARADMLAQELAAQTKKLGEEEQRAKEKEAELHAVRKTAGDVGKQLQGANKALDILRGEHQDLQKKLKNTTNTLRKKLPPGNKNNVWAPAEAKPKRETRTPEQISSIREQAVLILLRKYAAEPDLYIAPNIPADKLANASLKANFGSRKALGLVNCTVFGSAKDSILFSPDAIFWHNMTGSHGSLDYSEIDGNTVKLDGRVLRANDRKIDFSGTSMGRESLLTLTKELAALAHLKA